MKKDLSGIKIGRLEALYSTGKNKYGGYIWLCRCDCGNEHKVLGSDFNRGKIKSCGCLRKEIGNRNIKHGYNGTITYKSWQSMKDKGNTLDRIDNNRNYTPENCKWSTYEEQARNRITSKLSKSKVKIIKKFIKDNKNISEIANIFNVSRGTIYDIKKNRIWRNIE